MMNETILDKKYRDILSRPVGEGGLNLLLPSKSCSEHSRSIRVCALFSKQCVVDAKETQNNVIQKIKMEKRIDLREKKKKSENNCQLKNYNVPIVPQKNQKKQLSVLPLKRYSFKDCLALRYRDDPKNIPNEHSMKISL